jgi:hypothetical protein
VNTLPALRTHKNIEVCQLRDRDMLPAVRTFQHSNRIGFVIFAFRVYGRHGAIVARASDAVAGFSSSCTSSCAVFLPPAIRERSRYVFAGSRPALLRQSTQCIRAGDSCSSFGSVGRLFCSFSVRPPGRLPACGFGCAARLRRDGFARDSSSNRTASRM